MAINKTETVIFRKTSGRHAAQLDIGEKSITTRTSMKYLGVVVDEGWTMKYHFKYIVEKSENIIKNLGRLMPNVGGSRENRRRLYSLIVHSVILCAAPLGVKELHKTKAKKELMALWNLQNKWVLEPLQHIER